MMTKVSLIIPSWNTPEHFYKDCLNSVASIKGINYNNFEFIIVDDGATDNTPAIADEYASRCPFIRVIHQENKGNCAARNTGMKESAGNYIIFLDCDDFVDNNILINCLKSINDYPDEDIMQYSTDFRHEDKSMMRPVNLPDAISYFPSLPPAHIFCWNKIFRKAFLIDNDIWFPTVGEIPQTYTGFLKNYVCGEDHYQMNLAYAVAGKMRLLPWSGMTHIARSDSLCQVTHKDGQRACAAEYIMWCCLLKDARKRNLPKLIDFVKNYMQRNYFHSIQPELLPEEFRSPDFLR